MPSTSPPNASILFNRTLVVSFDCRHRDPPVDERWRCKVCFGRADGGCRRVAAMSLRAMEPVCFSTADLLVILRHRKGPATTLRTNQQNLMAASRIPSKMPMVICSAPKIQGAFLLPDCTSTALLLRDKATTGSVRVSVAFAFKPFC